MSTHDDLDFLATEATSGQPNQLQQIPQGTLLGRYIIIELIGAGGMGAVYQAFDPELNRIVALKILSVKKRDKQKAQRAKARLIREAQALAQLSHPNVVAVHDVGTFEDDVFIAMERVEGKTLVHWMKQEHLSIKEKVRVMVAAAEGLYAAHQAGLIHRDFKPSNVIVGEDGRVRVLDFGIARTVDSEPGVAKPDSSIEQQSSSTFDRDPQSQEQFEQSGPKSTESDTSSPKSITDTDLDLSSSPNYLHTPLTRAGGVVGTPMYMSPEQHKGKEVDERTDQFSFCLVLYEVLYGQRPFEALSRNHLYKQIRKGNISKAPAGSKVPAWLRRVAVRGLQAVPDQRYDSMHTLIEDLQKDPAATKKKIMLAGLLSLLFFGIVLVMGYELIQQKQRCNSAFGQLAGVWDATIQERCRNAFLATKKTYAAHAWKEVQRIFDDYTNQWVNMHRQACEATHIRAEQSLDLMDLRMLCLTNRLNEIHSLAKLFMHANGQEVKKAVQAAYGITPISECADIEALLAEVKPPKDKHTREQVSALRSTLAQIKAQAAIGQYKQGLELAVQAATQANNIGYEPASARALYWLGFLQELNGTYEAAKNTMYDSYFRAIKINDDKTAAKAIIRLIFVVGYQLNQFKEAERLIQHADAIIVRTGDHPDDRATWHSFAASVYYTQRDYQKQTEHDQKALALYEKNHGPKHLLVAKSLNNLGLAYRKQGKYKVATGLYQRSLAILTKKLGPAHPTTALIWFNLGNLAFITHDFDKALAYQMRVLANWEKVYGPEHPEIAKPLTTIASVYLEQNQCEKALETYFRTLHIREKALGPDHPQVGQSLNNISTVYHSLGQYDKAYTYARRSLEIRRKVLGPKHPDLIYPLFTLGNTLKAQKKYAQAVKLWEEALDICKDKTCDSSTLASIQFELAQSLATQNCKQMGVMRDRHICQQRALALAHTARAAYAQLEGESKSVAEIDRWLTAHAEQTSISDVHRPSPH